MTQPPLLQVIKYVYLPIAGVFCLMTMARWAFASAGSGLETELDHILFVIGMPAGFLWYQRKRIKLLAPSKISENRVSYWIVLFGLFILHSAAVIFSLPITKSNIIHLDEPSEIKENYPKRFYTIKKFTLQPEQRASWTYSTESPRARSLELYQVFIIPLIDSGKYDSVSTFNICIGLEFFTEISYDLSDGKIAEIQSDFLSRNQKKAAGITAEKITYFERLISFSDREPFYNAAQAARPNQNADPIVLIPRYESFERRLILSWVYFGLATMGVLIGILAVILLAGIDQKEWEKFIGSRQKENP